MAIRKATTLLVVHVTATPPKLDIGAKEVDGMHKALGWSGIGYHDVIRRDGQVENGRGETLVGSHVAGFNSTSIGVSMVGGVDANGVPQDNATPEQYRALETLLRELSGRYPNAKVCGHRDLSPDKDHDGLIEPHEHIKACPCFDAIPWAVARGLPASPIKGAWGKIIIPAGGGEKVTVVTGPDGREVYLQKLLARAGYRFGAIDGDIGPLTQAAIKQYQLFAGLHQSGQFDTATVARLRAQFETAKAA